jgi:glycosyltransferase involved in cell wall biosynthesis
VIDAPVVSVVTPVYNGERYLTECIESVLRQTYPHWEYLLFDNVSTDSTPAIVDRHAAADGRIRVTHATEFVDATPNQNRAVRAIDPRSRYLKILHADDWLYPECLERMVGLADSNPTVGLVSSFRLVGDHVEHRSPMPYNQSVMPGRDVVRWELFGPRGAWVTGADTSVMFRAEFARQVHDFYDESDWHNDTDTAYRVLLQSDFGFVHQILTFTRRHSEGINPVSQRVWSFISRDGRHLIRYGPQLLSSREYRARLRKWLVRYGVWLAKQAVRPSRRKQPEFAEFHRKEIDNLMQLCRTDREAYLALATYRRLLL